MKSFIRFNNLNKLIFLHVPLQFNILLREPLYNSKLVLLLLLCLIYSNLNIFDCQRKIFNKWLVE